MFSSSGSWKSWLSSLEVTENVVKYAESSKTALLQFNPLQSIGSNGSFLPLTSSPNSASCHPHSVTASTENNHFIQSIKHPGEKKKDNSILDCSYFLLSLSRKLAFLPFFPSPIPTTGSPSKTFRGNPSPSSHQGLLGPLMCFTAGSIPHLGSRRPFRRRKGNLIESHYIVCYHLVLTSPIPTDQQPHRAPSTTDALWSREKSKRRCFLAIRAYYISCKAF